MSKKFWINLVIAVALFSVTMYGVQNCGAPFQPTFVAQAVTVNGIDYVQIERLARPAVNEGLVLSNDKLIAFNSIPPTLDLATDNPAVLAVLQEASAALDLVDSLEGADTFGDGFDSQVVAGFLPDVMRIDVSKSFGVADSAYNGDFVVVEGTDAAMLTGGRKLMDDVVDITLSYLVAGDPTGEAVKDNVSYQGYPGNAAQGHKMLHGQTSYNGPAQFPFLAAPY